jgi:hypothetical protein
MWITELYEKQDHAATEHAKNQEIISKKCSLMVSALSSWMLLHRSRAGGFLLHHHSVWCCYQIEFRPRCLQESAMKPAFNIKKPSQILKRTYRMSHMIFLLFWILLIEDHSLHFHSEKTCKLKTPAITWDEVAELEYG